MSYEVMGSLFDRREDAVHALIDAFLWADGMNVPKEVANAIRDAEGTADELVANWDTNIAHGDDERDELSREEILATLQSIVAVKYADPTEGAGSVYDEDTARQVAAEDPSLIIWIK